MSTIPATDLIATAIFLLCLGTTAFGAIVAISSGRLIRSVTGLAICCFGVAGLYYFLHSPFLALMEILIYVGAVCVTIVFAVMLAEPEEPARKESLKSALAWGGVSAAAAGAIFWGLLVLGTRAHWPSPVRTKDGSIWDIGVALLTTYSMAFELISLALLVAILGALAIARTGRYLERSSAAAAVVSPSRNTVTASSPTRASASASTSTDPGANLDSQLSTITSR